MATILLVSLGIFFILNVPIAISLGGASAFALIIDGKTPLILIAQRMFSGLDSFPYMALPFFVLAGNMMAAGGISRRLINFSTTLVGRMQGGLAIVTILACMFFAAISGSSAATAAAIGSIMIPGMVSSKYKINFAAATVASSAELGVIIPPSVPMVLYCVAVGASVGKLFIAGVIPGILIGVSLMLVAHHIAKKEGFLGTRAYTLKEVWIAFKDSLLAFTMPIIILGGIYGGIFTPTEAAAVVTIYGFIVGAFIYREIKLRDLKSILLESAITAATILLIISTANLFGLIMSRERIPQMIAEVFMALSTNKYVFLLLVNLLLLFIGTMFETSASIIILSPLLYPIAMQFGIDPIHFGIVIIVNLAVGMVTPPVGINLFVTCNLAKIKIEAMAKYLVYYLAVLVLDIFIITYIPQLSLWLPNLLSAK